MFEHSISDVVVNKKYATNAHVNKSKIIIGGAGTPINLPSPGKPILETDFSRLL